MRTEQKYLFFWLVALLLSFAYFMLLATKFSSLSIGHLIQTCLTGISSIIHFSGDLMPLIIAPLAGLALLTIILKVSFSFIKTQTKLSQVVGRRTLNLPQKIKPLLLKHGILESEIVVVRSPQRFAYTIGFLSPQIILSTSLILALTPKELEAVILHEQYHLKQSHPLLFFIGEIVSSILFLLPIFEEFFNQMKFRFEVEADGFVLKNQRTSRYLLSSLQTITSSPIQRYYPNFAAYALEDRVGLLNHHLPKQHVFSVRNFTVSLVVVLLSLVIFRVPVNADETLNAQFGNACDATFTCSETCPSDRKSPMSSPVVRSDAQPRIISSVTSADY
jgi:Zn-dependent protease with chaperone function